MGKPIPEWVLEDAYNRLERAIKQLPGEIDISWAVELYERAGGDRASQPCRKLWAAAGEFTDAVNEMISHMEDMQHDIANRLPAED